MCLMVSAAAFSLIAGLKCFPQNEASAPPLPFEILKLKWEKQAKLPESFDPSNGGASGSINDSATSGGGSRGGAGGSGGSASTTQGLQAASPSRVFFTYVYSMKIRNTGSKEIEGVAWDYVFLDPSNSAEVGRHQFLSFEKVAANKTATFQSEQRTPPVRVIRNQNGDVNKHEKLVEKSVVQCVLYDDGTTWRNEKASSDTCNLLKKGKPGASHKRSAQE